MIRLIKLLFSAVLIIYFFTFVSAQAANSTRVSVPDSAKSLDDEARRRRKKDFFPFGHHLWWWGLKALSVLITVKIKIILLILFIGGGIFYGLKVWQGSALGCPEPIISEVKHPGFDHILPYHGHLSHDIGFAEPPPDFGGYSGYDVSSVYSNTPGPSYLPASGSSGPSYLPASGSLSSVDTSGTSATSNNYLPPTNRRNAYSTGRAMSDSSANVLSDLMFRFLGVKTETCKRRFICELEFKNPFLSYALNYIGNDVFKRYRLPKESLKYPKKYSDCERLYSECEIPKEGYAVNNRRRYRLRKKNQTVTQQEELTTQENSTENIDLVTKYVKDQEK